MYFLIARCFHVRTHTHTHAEQASQMLVVVLQLLSCFFIVATIAVCSRCCCCHGHHHHRRRHRSSYASNRMENVADAATDTVYFFSSSDIYLHRWHETLASWCTYCINILTIIAQFKPSTRPTRCLNTNDIIYFITRFIHFKHGISKCKCALFFPLQPFFSFSRLFIVSHTARPLTGVQHTIGCIGGRKVARLHCLYAFCFESHGILMMVSNNCNNALRETFACKIEWCRSKWGRFCWIYI